MSDNAKPQPGALPLYLRISELLSREIRSGRLVNGSKLPTERDLAQSLDVAVGTLRKALTVLQDNGLIERVQGSGNYVRCGEVKQTIYALFRLERLDGGGLPTAEILSVDHLSKPTDAPPFGPSAMAHRFRRLRYLDAEPVALEEIWLDADRAVEIDPQSVSESLYYYYATVLGLYVGQCIDRVGVGAVPEWSDPRFALPVGAPSGYVERVTEDQDGKTFEFSRSWFDPARTRYVSRLK